jgi:D-alanine-D-alanine ligase
MWRQEVEELELKEAELHASGNRLAAKAEIPKGTPLLKIRGTILESPDGQTIQIEEGCHISPQGALWGKLGHSCTPNCFIEFDTWSFCAARKIEAGEELSYDYLTTEWELAEPFPCACGGANCRGMITGFRYLEPSRQEELSLLCSPYLLRRLFEAAPLRPQRSPRSRDSKWRTPVYVFVPYFFKDGSMESVGYDIQGFRAEVKCWFEALRLPWRWIPITLGNLANTIETLQRFRQTGDLTVLNLCDGDEIDASPGISVVRALEQAGIRFTGASSHFYHVTTPKVTMKELLLSKGVPTPPFVAIRDLERDIPVLEQEVGYPVLINPEISSASNGISLRSLVRDRQSALAQVRRLLDGGEGDQYRKSGVFAERFVQGREFTVLLVGNHEHPDAVRVYPPAERVFHSALPPHERFLSYDRYWSEFKEEPKPPEGEPFYRYAPAPSRIKERLADLAVQAFLALGGTGYARVDIRMDSRSEELFVLEVNSNCGLSGDRETSAGEILHLSRRPIHRLISQILQAAHQRHIEQRMKSPG